MRKGELEVGALLQECTNKGNCKPSWPSREMSHKAIPSTWEGVALWDPGGRPSREQILNSKRPVEAKDIAPGIVTHKKNPGCTKPSQSGSTVMRGQPCTFTYVPSIPSCHQGVHLLFISRPIKRAWHHPGQCRAETLQQGQGNTAIWWLSHLCHTPSHVSPHHTHSGALAEKFNAWPQPLNTILVHPHFHLEAFCCSA